MYGSGLWDRVADKGPEERPLQPHGVDGVELLNLGLAIWEDRANFGGLVLGCIEASDSESRRIFQHFSRSTRFSPLRTALNPKFQQKTCQNFFIFLQKFRKILLNFVQILLNFNEISPEFRQNARR